VAPGSTLVEVVARRGRVHLHARCKGLTLVASRKVGHNSVRLGQVPRHKDPAWVVGMPVLALGIHPPREGVASLNEGLSRWGTESCLSM